MSAEADYRAAQADSAAARRRLLASVEKLKHRVSPRTVAAEAVDGAKQRANALAATTSDAAQRHPRIAVALGVTAAGLLLRRPITRLFGKLRRTRPDEQEPTEA
jgi:ElaB/YqjD/DUF883 family membrane-anchored ribosome-binding protein